MRIPASRLALIVALLVLPLAQAAPTSRAAESEEWPGWRGPRGDGSSLETNLPTTWSQTENVHWKIKVPGRGHSSPIVWGDRVFLTTALEDQQERMLLCLNRADGQQIWEREVLTSPLEGKHNLNSYASSTPATDGTHVWVSFYKEPDIVVACYDFDGNEVWRKSPGTFSSIHGFCSSPVLYKDLVILNCDQDAQAWIVAYDKTTGEERWRTDRPNRVRSYCVPTVFHMAGKDQMVLSGSECVASYDPASGEQYWVIDGPTEQMVASLVHADGVLFVTGGYPEHHLWGLRPDGMGELSGKDAVLWHHTRGVSYVPSPVAHDKWFFIVSDDGIASCIEAKTGKIQWHERLDVPHSASLVVADGNVYFTDDEGKTTVVKAGPKFEVVAENDLGEKISASPAVSRGQIFIRAFDHLYCIGKPSAGATATAE